MGAEGLLLTSRAEEAKTRLAARSVACLDGAPLVRAGCCFCLRRNIASRTPDNGPQPKTALIIGTSVHSDKPDVAQHGRFAGFDVVDDAPLPASNVPRGDR
jgi:hypothetical protein